MKLLSTSYLAIAPFPSVLSSPPGSLSINILGLLDLSSALLVSHESSARGWCTGKTQRDQGGREVGGGGMGMGNTCNSMADSCQCMANTTTILQSN